MTQNAKVMKLLDGGKALVLVRRMSACGENCASCSAGCGEKNKATVIALNRISANVGDEVVISSKTSKILSAAFMAYILPLLLFFIAYISTDAANLPQRISIIISVAAFFCGIGAGFAYDRLMRKKNSIQFEITSFVK